MLVRKHEIYAIPDQFLPYLHVFGKDLPLDGFEVPDVFFTHN